jgi:hypothetical protein
LIIVLKFIAALITVSAGMTARVSALVHEHDESVFSAAGAALLPTSGFGKRPFGYGGELIPQPIR